MYYETGGVAQVVEALSSVSNTAEKVYCVLVVSGNCVYQTKFNLLKYNALLLF
jgi:hypothetical protein